MLHAHVAVTVVIKDGPQEVLSLRDMNIFEALIVSVSSSISSQEP